MTIFKGSPGKERLGLISPLHRKALEAIVGCLENRFGLKRAVSNYYSNLKVRLVMETVKFNFTEIK